jgi:succinate dehydrogenase/fumarate reductase flavoprotein subunit
MKQKSATRNLTNDVVIVGGGFGGMVAALAAAELGSRVTVLEAGGDFGGTAMHSGATAHIWGARTWEEYRRNCPTVEPRLARVLVDEYPRMAEWLVSTGAPGRFGEIKMRGNTIIGYQLGNGLVPESKRRWFDFVRDRLVSQGATLMVNTRGLELQTSGGRVTGVVARRESGGRLEDVTVAASAVILACGGYQADFARLSEYLGHPAPIVQRSVPYNVGDGLRMAQAMGAALTASMETVYGHLMPAAPCEISWTNFIDPLVVSAYYAAYGIVLNAQGRRFVDEGAGENSGVTANEGLKQSGDLWVVMDSKVRSRYARYEFPWELIRPTNLRYAGLLPYMRLRRRRRTLEVTIDSLGVSQKLGAVVLKAESVEALGDALSSHGVDGQAAVTTMREYDEAVRDGRAGSLAIPRTKSAERLSAPPFYAIKVGVGISMTYGGVQIDTEARVLDDADQPIPGLFAIPGTAGGVSHIYYGGALSACGVFGRIAGVGAARAAQVDGRYPATSNVLEPAIEPGIEGRSFS